MGDSLWIIMLLALMFPIDNFDTNYINYLDKYEKYGDEE